MNLTFDLDTSGNVLLPDVFLCKRNLQKYSVIYSIENIVLSFNLNAFNEISFVTYKTINGKDYENWDDISDYKIVFIPKYGYFEITVLNELDGTNEKKKVSGKSLEVELDHIRLFDFQINSDDINDSDYMSPVKFYDPTNTQCSLLHRVLQKAPAWSISHVDAELWDKQRTFDVDDTSIYELLTGDIAKEFSCIFQFDSFNRTISCYSLATYGKNTNVYLDYSNYVDLVKMESPADQIFNWFKVKGGDDVIDIREVNPNGTDYITMLGDNDKKDMSPELVRKLDEYDILYLDNQNKYIEIMERMQAQVEIIWDLYHKYPENIEDKNYSLYGLNYLLEKETFYQQTETYFTSRGYGTASSSHYSQYKENHDNLAEVRLAITKKREEITRQEEIENSIKSERDNLQNTLGLENYLGKDLWKELSSYRRESVYQNQFFTITDYTTDQERIKMELELFQRASEELTKACNPQFSLKSTVKNLMVRKEFQTMAVNDFQLGNFIHIGVNDNYVAKLRIISISYDYDNID